MRAAMYLRISLDRYGDGLAVDRQQQDCERLIEARGWELVETYTDNSVSASDSSKARPAYNRMVDDWKRGRFDALVCWDLDRLTRQPRQLEDWIDAAEQRGLRIVTANGEADLGTDAGRMFARIKAAVARQEVDRKSARQKRAAQQRAERGQSWGSRRPFGFMADQTTHHPVEAGIVRGMYDDFLNGVGQREIVRRLTARGVKTTMGNDWSQPVLRNFLLNPRNAGLRAYKGEVVSEAAWEPLVDEATWRATVDRLEGRGGPTYSRARKHLLVGVATCGVCGEGMRTNYTVAGARQYVCPKHHVARRADLVDDLVVSTALAILKRTPDVGRRDDAEGRDLLAQAAALRARLESLATEFADGVLTGQQLRTATERTRSNLAAVEGQIARAAEGTALGALAGASDLHGAWERLGVERQRSAIEALMTVTIHPTTRGHVFSADDVEMTPRD